jgi:bacterioferritin
MKGKSSIIEALNKSLGNELIAINQYFLHARILKNWGFEKLAKITYEESIDEMKHAELLNDRILFLDGLPNMQDLGKLRIGQTVLEMLECDLKLEQKAIPDLVSGIELAEKEKDYVTRDLFKNILESEEEHYDFLETQIELYHKIGEQNYLQSQI